MLFAKRVHYILFFCPLSCFALYPLSVLLWLSIFCCIGMVRCFYMKYSRCSGVLVVVLKMFISVWNNENDGKHLIEVDLNSVGHTRCAPCLKVGGWVDGNCRIGVHNEHPNIEDKGATNIMLKFLSLILHTRQKLIYSTIYTESNVTVSQFFSWKIIENTILWSIFEAKNLYEK